MYARNLPPVSPSRPASRVVGSFSAPRVLPSGMFFGRPAVERETGPLRFSVRDADPGRVIERHAHEDAHLVLVLAGTYVSGARDLPLDGPVLVYNPPGITHRDRFAGEPGRFVGRFFTLSAPQGMAVGEAGTRIASGHARALRHPDALALAAVLARIVGRNDAEAGLACEALGNELLHHAVHGSAPVEGSVPAWLPRVVERIRDVGTECPSVRELARDANVHPVYLARAFRRFVGCSPAELARRARLRRAVAWIIGTTHPLAEVAAKCGFADQSHMTRAVTRARGASPLQLRLAGSGGRSSPPAAAR